MLLPSLERGVDGNEDDRRGTVSAFNGPDPEVRVFDDGSQEAEALALWVHEAIDDGLEPDEIGLFVRSNNELARARAVVQQAGQPRPFPFPHPLNAAGRAPSGAPAPKQKAARARSARPRARRARRDVIVEGGSCSTPLQKYTSAMERN